MPAVVQTQHLPWLLSGWPLALLEAMDAGLPVMATRVIGSEEVVVRADEAARRFGAGS